MSENIKEKYFDGNGGFITIDELIEKVNNLSNRVDCLEEELTHTKEFCDYFIHNREQLTKQLSYWMDKVDKLEKKLEIGLWALRVYSNVNPPMYSSEEDEESSYTSKLYDYRIAREALEKIGEIK